VLYTSVAHDIGDHDNHKTLLYMPALYKLSKESAPLKRSMSYGIGHGDTIRSLTSIGQTIV